MRKFLSILLILFLLLSCGPAGKKDKTIDSPYIRSMDLLSNWSDIAQEYREEGRPPTLYLDYDDAFDGFMLPSPKQSPDGFIANISLINPEKKEVEYFLALFFQNESYKFNEVLENGEEHPFCTENFYGCPTEGNTCFHSSGNIPAGQDKNISIPYRILGNPRNEAIYFSDSINERWKRNPRPGIYSMMLVVLPSASIHELPAWVKNKSFADSAGHLHNPYYYFLYGAGSKITGISVIMQDSLMHLKASVPLAKGTYYNDRLITDYTPPADMAKQCACDNDAAIEVFLHHIDTSVWMDNIPLTYDVVGDNYNQSQYFWNRAFYSREERIRLLPSVTDDPCRSAYYDSVNRRMTIVNPASTYGHWKKQNAGIITRHGFSYGTYTVKCKLSRLLSDDGVWNGLTNAVWLITQSGEEWNFVRTCNTEGYMSSYGGGDADTRVTQVGYSEIDFEILKTVPYCPSYSFPPIYAYHRADPLEFNSWMGQMPEAVENDRQNICVACTNWDMA